MIKNDQKNLEDALYTKSNCFQTIAMITDSNGENGDKKHEGILVIVPLFKAGTKIELKNVTLVTSNVNTCKSQTAIIAGKDEYNRKYTEELKDMFDNFKVKLRDLKQMEKLQPNKYTEQQVQSVLDFLDGIQKKIGDDVNKIANGVYESNTGKIDLLGALERISENRVKGWAMSFNGYDDSDTFNLVTDDEGRNPVEIFFGTKRQTTNGSGLKSLMSKSKFDYINECLAAKLGDKDFSKERKKKNDHMPGYRYFVSYFVQVLLEIVLVDNNGKLSSLDLYGIEENWENFLKEVNVPEYKNVFDSYNYDKSEAEDCPKQFVKFMLSKLLSEELLEQLKINGDDVLEKYARAALSISDSLAMADHANQIITVAFDNNLDGLNYGNSTFIGQGDFVYAPLYTAYRNLEVDTQNKLKLLAFELKSKNIKLDQRDTTTSEEYRYGRLQEIERVKKEAVDPKTGKTVMETTKEIASIKYKVPTCYDTDISAEDLIELVLKIQTLEKNLSDKLANGINQFDKDKNAKAFLEVLAEFQKVGVMLTNTQVDNILKKENLLQTMYGAVNEGNEKYKNVYAWFINEHDRVIDEMDKDYLIKDLLSSAGAVKRFYDRCFFYQEENKKQNEERANFLLFFGKKKLLDKELISGINKTILDAMLNQDQKTANEIIKTYLYLFSKEQIRSINLDQKLSADVISTIFIKNHEILTEKQIQDMNLSELDPFCDRILFDNYKNKISQQNINTLPEERLEKLQLKPRQLLELLINKPDLNFKKHGNWLKGLYLGDLLSFCDKLSGDEALLICQEKSDFRRLSGDQAKLICQEAVVKFINTHLEIFSKVQILSLKKAFLTKVKEQSEGKDNKNKKEIVSCVKNILNRLGEIESQGGKTEKVIAKIMALPYGDWDFCRRALATMFDMFPNLSSDSDEDKKDEEDFKKLLQFLIENNRSFCYSLDEIFWFIIIFDIESASREDKNEDGSTSTLGLFREECKDKNIAFDAMKKFTERIRPLLDKSLGVGVDSKDVGIDKLDLAKLPMLSGEFLSKEKYRKRLSAEAIGKIKLYEYDITLKGLNILLENFSDKLCFGQLEELIDKFNSLTLDPSREFDGATVSGVDLLAKIATISNYIDDKEKKCNDKYGPIKSKLEEVIESFNEKVNDDAQKIQNPNQYYDEHKFCYELLDNDKGNCDVDKGTIITLSKDDIEQLEKLISDKVEWNKNKDALRERLNILCQQYNKAKAKFLGPVRQLKELFMAARESMDLEKVRKCIESVYMFNDKSIQERNKKLNDYYSDDDPNLSIVKLESTEKYSFNQIFMRGFLNTQNRFSKKHRELLGVINEVDSVEQENNVDGTKLISHTPEYILKNLPLILHGCHCNENQLNDEMRKRGLSNLILKFDKDSKVSLERFIDTDDNDYQAFPEGARYKDENFWYFRAIKKLFCDHADNIVDNADLEFERENGNTNGKVKSDSKIQIQKSKCMQRAFHAELMKLTQKTEIVPQNEITNKAIEKREVKTKNNLDKTTIIQNLYSADKKLLDRFTFFLGDWICTSEKFRAEEKFLDRFKKIVAGRIDFGCRSNDGVYNEHERKNNKELVNKNKALVNNKACYLSDEAYDLLTACALLSGLNQSKEMKIASNLMSEICKLITGKDKDFVQDDMELIFKCCLATDTNRSINADEKYRKMSSVTLSVVEYVIKNQKNQQTLKFVINFFKDKIENSQRKNIVKCITNSKEIDYMDLLSLIVATEFYQAEIDSDFVNDLTSQLAKKYKYGEYPSYEQKNMLKEFLAKESFCKTGEVDFGFLAEIIAKVPPQNLKDAIGEIIGIFAYNGGLYRCREFLKYIVDLNNMKSIYTSTDLLKILKGHNYSKIQVDFDIVQKLMSGMLEKTGKFTQEDIDLLKWFCVSIKCDKDYSDEDEKQKKLFSKLVKKMPNGSISKDMFCHLINNIFPNLADEYKPNATEAEILNLKIKLNILNIETAKALAYALSESEYVLKDYMPDCTKKNEYAQYKGKPSYSFEPEYFFNSLSTDDLKNKNMRALLFSVYRDFNLSKEPKSEKNFDNENKDTFEEYNSTFYALMSKFPHNEVVEDELEQLISISIKEPENLEFDSHCRGNVGMMSKYYSIERKKLLAILAVIKEDCFDSFITLINKVKRVQRSCYRIKGMEPTDEESSNEQATLYTEIKSEDSLVIKSTDWGFSDWLNLINDSKRATQLGKIVYDEKITNPDDFCSTWYSEYSKFDGKIKRFTEEMDKFPVLVSQNFRITDDFIANLKHFLSSTVLPKKYDELRGSSYMVMLSYYLLRMYFLLSDGESVNDMFNKLDLPKEKVSLSENGNLEILLDDSKIILQGFSEVDLAKEKLILIPKSQSFISKDFIRSIKLLNEREKEKKSLCLGIKYEDDTHSVSYQGDKKIQLSFVTNNINIIEAERNRQKLIGYVINNFASLFLEDKKGIDNFDIVISFLFELNRKYLDMNENNMKISVYENLYWQQLSNLVNKLSSFITPDNDLVIIDGMIKKLKDIKTHVVELLGGHINDNDFDVLMQALENKCSEAKSKKIVLEQQKTKIAEKEEKKLQEQKLNDKKTENKKEDQKDLILGHNDINKNEKKNEDEIENQEKQGDKNDGSKPKNTTNNKSIQPKNKEITFGQLLKNAKAEALGEFLENKSDIDNTNLETVLFNHYLGKQKVRGFINYVIELKEEDLGAKKEKLMLGVFRLVNYIINNFKEFSLLQNKKRVASFVIPLVRCINLFQDNTLEELKVEEVAEFVKNILGIKELWLTFYEKDFFSVEQMFKFINSAILKCKDGKDLSSTKVIALAQQAWTIFKEQAKKDLTYRKVKKGASMTMFEFAALQALNTAIEQSSAKLECQDVKNLFDLVKDILTYDEIVLSSNIIEEMFKAIKNAITEIKNKNSKTGTKLQFNFKDGFKTIGLAIDEEGNVVLEGTDKLKESVGEQSFALISEFISKGKENEKPKTNTVININNNIDNNNTRTSDKSEKNNSAPLDTLKLQLTNIENKLNSPENNNNNQTPKQLLGELNDAFGKTLNDIKGKNADEKKIIDKDTFARITNILGNIQKQFKNNNYEKGDISQTIENIYYCLVNELVQKQSLDTNSFLEFLGILNKLGKSFDLQIFMAHSEKQILSINKSKEDIKKILEFIPKSNMQLEDIQHIGDFLENIKSIVTYQDKGQQTTKSILEPEALFNMFMDCGVFRYCFKYLLVHEIKSIDPNQLITAINGIIGGIAKVCLVNNLNQNIGPEMKNRIFQVINNVINDTDVIVNANTKNNTEKLEQVKKTLESGMSDIADNIREKTSEKQEILHYERDQDQQCGRNNLNQERNKDSKLANNYVPKPSGTYVILATISIFFPPVFGIGLFVLKYKDPDHKITVKDIFLILVFSLPLCAPIVGFSMAYKASQQNQEMKAKNLTDINVGNSNDNKASIDDKMNNINQNEKGNINDADIGNNKGEIGN